MIKECFMMELYDKIKAIHASDAFGILVETGGGMPVSNALLQVEGASKTVYLAECPYSKSFQDKKYLNAKTVVQASDLSEADEKIRAVSMEMIEAVINHHLQDNLNASEPPINFIYASTFQIGNHNDKSTHGWIGLWTRLRGIRYFHISIHDSLSRIEYIKKISQIGIDLIHHFTVYENAICIPGNCCIDNFYKSTPNVSEGLSNHMNKFLLIESLKKESDENFLCIRDGRFVRMEDFFRDKKEILIYKGSFNPIHNGHVNNIEMTRDRFGSNPIVTFSLEVFQKGWIDTMDLLKRIEMVTSLGYDVMITKNGLFNENTKYIRKKFNTTIIYVVGTDVMHKLLKSSYNILNVEESEEYKRETAMENVPMAIHTQKYLNAILFYLNLFKVDFNNVKFFCIARKGYDEFNNDLSDINDYIIYADERRHVPEYYYISSTKIRELKAENKIDDIKKMMPERAFKRYLES